ncbi:MAG TPA: SpoIID/LytB domain-containing protein [Candidatus Krumholzibacteria bacterium]|nr:SpoIID/LytB domain-containing protein [Candidatus Krumholzibacteria bacterium]
MTLMKMASVALATAGLWVPLGGPASAAQTRVEPTIRVLVFSTSGSATVATTAGFRVLAGGALKFESDRGGTVSVYRDGRTLTVRHDATSQSASNETEVTIEPVEKPLSVGGVWYPGSIRALPREDGGVDLVSLVPLETYLEGVVPHEIGEPGPDAYAAVQAQAIAARTYAMSRMKLNRDKPYDVEAGVMDQVYRGNEKRGRMTSSAVYDTRGLVLMHDGDLCDAYYSATCGGHTSDIRKIWPDRPSAPYLHGRRDRGEEGGESFCAAARNFRWRYSFSGRALGDTVRRTLPMVAGVDESEVGELVDVRVRRRSASGRVQELEIVTSTRSFVVENDKIRRVVMLDVGKGRILPSTLFDVETTMNGARVGIVSFAGGGNGHGVGMCQNGALGMARKGYSYSMILQHYYPGAELRPGYK